MFTEALRLRSLLQCTDSLCERIPSITLSVWLDLRHVRHFKIGASTGLWNSLLLKHNFSKNKLYDLFKENSLQRALQNSIFSLIRFPRSER